MKKNITPYINARQCCKWAHYFTYFIPESWSSLQIESIGYNIFNIKQEIMVARQIVGPRECSFSAMILLWIVLEMLNYERRKRHLNSLLSNPIPEKFRGIMSQRNERWPSKTELRQYDCHLFGGMEPKYIANMLLNNILEISCLIK